MRNFIILLVILAVLAVGAYVIFDKDGSGTALEPSASTSPKASSTATTSPSTTVSPTATSTSSPTKMPTPTGTKTPTPTATATPRTYTIRITSAGVLPKNLTIKRGDTVTFLNDDNSPHWPASDPHPTHTLCPGFDADRGLPKGSQYSFTFRELKSCPFHDHLNAGDTSLRGTITVQ